MISISYYNHAPFYRVTLVEAIYAVCIRSCNLPAMLTVISQLRAATAVTQGCYGSRNNSQRKRLTREKKILSSLLLGLKPGRDLSIPSSSLYH